MVRDTKFVIISFPFSSSLSLLFGQCQPCLSFNFPPSIYCLGYIETQSGHSLISYVVTFHLSHYARRSKISLWLVRISVEHRLRGSFQYYSPTNLCSPNWIRHFSWHLSLVMSEGVLFSTRVNIINERGLMLKQERQPPL